VRVPIPWVLFLSLVMIGGVGWYGTRKTDFLTPPTASQLAACRAKVALSLTPTDHQNDVIAVPAVVADPATPTPAEEPKPTMILGDLDSPPTLQEYSDLAPKGAAHLIDLAVLLEVEGESQRALLAWERVLDTGKPDPSQTNTACIAIKRLRPTLPAWNTARAKAIAITLHAGTSKKSAKSLTPVLTDVARELERASAGLLQVTAVVSTGRVREPASGSTSAALWLAGPNKASASTKARSFAVKSPKSLHDDLLKSVLLIIRDHLGHATSHPPPVALPDDGKPLETLNYQITRLNWQELGTTLNRTPKKDE
jgi:hypothetical protein